MKQNPFSLKKLTVGIGIALLPMIGFAANATSAQAEHTCAR